MTGMTKQDYLDIIKLLSAMESWAFAQGKMMPDFLHEQLHQTMAALEKEVLK